MILVCGEALVDIFVGQPVGHELPTEAVAGGSPFNVAIGLARLQCPTALLATLSEDALGDFLASRLADAGVAGEYLVRCPQRTTLSVVATDHSGHPQYAFYSEGGDRALTPAGLPAILPDSINAIAAGSYSLGVEPVASAIGTLIAREADRRVISLDPNVRARVVGDVAAFRRRFEGLLAHATLVKASAEDAEALYGPSDLSAIAWDWLQRGPKLVVFTRGPVGPAAFSGGASVERPTPKVDVIDTVGAGDTFHAALLAHLDAAGLLTRNALVDLNEAEIAGALDYASAAAALVCTRRGADPPTRDDVRRFMNSGP
jgi:fructokinase